MVKLIFQTITQIEVDTETNRQRILKAFTKLLGEGNGAKKPKKQKAVVAEVAEVGEDEWC